MLIGLTTGMSDACRHQYFQLYDLNLDLTLRFKKKIPVSLDIHTLSVSLVNNITVQLKNMQKVYSITCSVYIYSDDAAKCQTFIIW